LQPIQMIACEPLH